MAEGDPFRQLSQSTEVPSTATSHLVPLPTDTGFWLRGEEELRAAPGEQHAGGGGRTQAGQREGLQDCLLPSRPLPDNCMGSCCTPKPGHPQLLKWGYGQRSPGSLCLVRTFVFCK